MSFDLETRTDNFVYKPQTDSLRLSTCVVFPPALLHQEFCTSWVWTRDPLEHFGESHSPPQLLLSALLSHPAWTDGQQIGLCVRPKTLVITPFPVRL